MDLVFYFCPVERAVSHTHVHAHRILDKHSPVGVNSTYAHSHKSLHWSVCAGTLVGHTHDYSPANVLNIRALHL